MSANKDGVVFTETNGIHIKDASQITLLLALGTSFHGFDKCPDKNGKDEHITTQQCLSKAAKETYQTLLKAHLADHHRFYNRVSLNINDFKNSRPKLPTDERLNYTLKAGTDNGLDVLYFNYGRYLLISSSRTQCTR